MNSCRPLLQRHPPDDVERQLWMWLESGRWHVANKRTYWGNDPAGPLLAMNEHSFN